MFTDKQLNNYAEALLWGLYKANKGEEFKTGDIVLVRWNLLSLPLAEKVYEKLLQRDLQPILYLLPTANHDVIFYENAKGHHLDFMVPWWKEQYKHVRGNIVIIADESLTHLENVDPKKQQRCAIAAKPWREFLTKQEEQGLFTWTLCVYPTQAPADKAGLTMKQFKSQIVKACYLNAKDAAAKWDQAYNVAGNIKSWLRSMDVDYYHVKSKNIDLKIRHGEKRKWLGIDGANIPSFEIFMSPDWRGTEGIYYADQPAYKGGKLIEGVRLEFKEGKVVKATADRNEDYLNKMVETDEDSCKVGEFSLTDTRLSKIDNFMANTLFDENYGGKYGNCHIAIGGSYSETYDGDPSELTDEIKKELGFSDSVIHWDLINTENKTVTAHMKDGSHTVIYESGIFNN